MISRRLLAFCLATSFAVPLFAADLPAPAQATKPYVNPIPAADQGSIKPDAGFMRTHANYVNLARKGGIDLYFVGDSITDNWHTSGKKVWDAAFAGWNPGNFGIGGDRTEHVLWRLQNGELEGVSPKVFVIMIGTNNVGSSSPEQVATGVGAIVKEIRDKNSQAKLLLLAIFPRSAKPTDGPRVANEAANKLIAKLDDGKTVKFLDIGKKFLAEDGTLSKDIMPDLLHPNEKGYQIWADAITPVLTEWLGKPAAPK